MLFKFTILDRNNVSTIIDEPIGWDANTMELKRDLEVHGISFETQGWNFEFHGKAYKMLKAEYEQYGIEGNMTLILEEDCGNGYEEFGRAKFMFKNYDYFCGGECYVKIPLETTSEVKDIRNRFNQKVNIDTLVAFDNTTALLPYTALGFNLVLPSKGIFIKNENNNKESNVEVFDGNILPPYNTGVNNTAAHAMEFGFNKKISSEIGNFYNPTIHLLTKIYYGGGDPAVFDGVQPIYHSVPGMAFDTPIYPLNCSPFLNYNEGSPNYGAITNPINLEINVNGELEIQESYVGTVCLHLLHLPFRKRVDNGELESDYNYVWEYPLFCKTGTSFPTDYFNGIINIGVNYTGQITLAKDDRYYFFMSISEIKSAANINAVNAGYKAFKLTLNDQNGGSFIKLTNLSKTKATIAKTYLVNEVWSRIVESLTNNNVKAYSEYFGRTDSQPYSHNADGCGSLEAVTDGLRIRRQENKLSNNPTFFSLSLQDMWEGLHPIHNIGFGIEPDINRPGFNRLRIEPSKYFYDNTVIYSCLNVGAITRKATEKEIYSTFQFGYAKWEAEEYTGLDEFLTKRTYRTTLSQIKNDLVKLSKFVASGYALEITRRKGENSKDWRFDKDTFIICLIRNNFFNVTFVAATNSMIFETTTINSNQFTFPTITIGGTLNNNGIRTISSISTSGSGGGITTVEIEFSGGTTIDEICATVIFPSITFTNNLSVELGNINTPQNIIDSDTIYNFRISPIRNAMRWMNKVFESYKQFGNNCKLIFTDGDANYHAAGEMIGANCKQENQSIAENITIDTTIYQNTINAKPFKTAERIIFDDAISSKNYTVLKNNKYGLIYFSNDCEEGYGWIDTIHYKPVQGIATFTLIPKTN
jgi:hypothetical protein